MPFAEVDLSAEDGGAIADMVRNRLSINLLVLRKILSFFRAIGEMGTDKVFENRLKCVNFAYSK